jgi:diadenosine tetraphosphate (Ap4A) HIT family hydrolase
MPEIADFTKPIIETEHFIAGQCINTDVPGYLVLRFQGSVRNLSEVPREVLSQFGPILARLEAVIATVTKADHVYIARFSEAMASVHFHLFPRSSNLGMQFVAESHNKEHGVNGPLLFDWARRKFHIDSPSQFSSTTLETANQIRELLRDK